MKEKRRIVVVFCIAIGLLATVGVGFYFNAQKYDAITPSINKSRKIIYQAKLIYSLAQEIETTQRGYVITGNVHSLGPFYKAIQGGKDISVNTNKHDLNTQNAINQLVDLLDEKIGFATRVVELRKKSGFEAAQQLIMTFQGEQLINSIRSETDDVVKEQELLINQQLQLSENQSEKSIWLIILTVILSIITLLIVLYLYLKAHDKESESHKKTVETKDRLNKILETIPVGLFIVTSDGKPYFSNQYAEQLLGKQIGLTGSLDNLGTEHPIYIAGTDEHYPINEIPVVLALRGETASVDDLELERGTERMRLKIKSVPLFDHLGNIAFVISVCEDISAIKRADQELLMAKVEAEKSLVMKETFLANMSHEIRTPMNAILGFTDLLKQENISERQRDFVNTIHHSGENLLRIINDILDLSKIEANMMEFEEHPIDIPSVFRSLHTMLTPKANEKNLTLTFENDQRLNRTLIGDPTRLTQIIINLVGNAIKFTKTGGVCVEAQLIDEEIDTCKVVFSITDTGIGISPDKQYAIFERFRQAETDTTRSYGGTGLGLSISRQLVELQGGTMRMTSEVGKGSCFSFILQFIKPMEGHIPTNKRSIDFERIRALKIMLAEDNPINIKLVTNLFQQHEIQLKVVQNGQEVLDLLQQQSFDLILMDLEMPLINGYETTKIIRNDLKMSVPIIAMTAHAMAGEAEKCLKLGMNDFVTKPLDSTLLFDKIYQVALTDKPRIEKTIKLEDSSNDTSEKKMIGRIDLSYLHELSSGNKNFEKEMLALFLEQVPEELEEMKVAYLQLDARDVRNAAHRMKSSIPLVGANYLLPLLTQLEELIDLTNELTPMTDHVFKSIVEQLEACFPVVELELTAY